MSAYDDALVPWPKLIRLLMRFSRPERGMIAALVIASLILSVMEGGGLTLGLFALYRLLGSTGMADDFGGEPLGEWLAQLSTPTLVAAAAAAVIVAALLSAAVEILGQVVANRVTHRARRTVYDGYLESSYQHASRQGHGAMLDTLDYETPFVNEAVLHVSAILGHACAVLVYAAYLFFLSPILTGAALLFGLVLTGLLGLTASRLAKLGGRVSQYNERLLAHTVSTVEGLRTVRLHAAERDFCSRYADASGHVAKAHVDVAVAQGVVGTCRQIAKLGALALLIWIAFAFAVPAAVTIMAFALLIRLLPHVGDSEFRLTALFNSQVPLSIVYRATDRAAMPMPSAGRAPFTGLAREIRLEGVSFEHEPGTPVLREVQCTIPAGALVTLIGPSGGGKTTLINLLARLYEPQAGRILVDGVPLLDIERESWLARLGFSGQDLDLQDGTVFDNIRFFDPSVSEADAMWAAKVAHIDDFVRGLPKGLQTRLGERGLNVSGGQRQRLGLARAIVRRPQLLILDEATNAVDIALEARILADVRAALPDATILVITHRTAIHGADRELMLSEGQVRPLERKAQA